MKCIKLFLPPVGVVGHQCEKKPFNAKQIWVSLLVQVKWNLSQAGRHSRGRWRKVLNYFMPYKNVYLAKEIDIA